MSHQGTFESRKDPTVLVCTCGRRFEGTWDEVAHAWKSHFKTFDDIVDASPIILDSAASERFTEILDGPRVELPPPARRIDRENDDA